MSRFSTNTHAVDNTRGALTPVALLEQSNTGRANPARSTCSVHERSSSSLTRDTMPLFFSDSSVCHARIIMKKGNNALCNTVIIRLPSLIVSSRAWGDQSYWDRRRSKLLRPVSLKQFRVISILAIFWADNHYNLLRI